VLRSTKMLDPSFSMESFEHELCANTSCPRSWTPT
jgi:hypothetical protein